MENINNKKEEIIKLYLSGKSAVQISKLFGVSYTPIYRILKDCNVEIRNSSLSHRKYNLDENYFDTIDRHSKSYILGLLFADGSNNTIKNTITLSLIKDDIDVIEYLKKELNYNNEIKHIKSKNINHKDQSKLSIFSKRISEKLENLGMIKNKTHFCKFPNIDKIFYYSFINGLFDGDGSFYLNENKKKYQISLTGNDIMINYIRDILNIDGIKTYIYIRNKQSQNILTLTIGGKHNCFNFLEKIYSFDNYKMKRKYDKFLYLKESIDKKENLIILSKERKYQELKQKELIKKNIESIILNSYNDGLSIRDINKKYNIDRRKISKILKLNGIKIKDRTDYEEKRVENFKNYYSKINL
jgi:hypothetical protein